MRSGHEKLVLYPSSFLLPFGRQGVLGESDECKCATTQIKQKQVVQRKALVCVVERLPLSLLRTQYKRARVYMAALALKGVMCHYMVYMQAHTLVIQKC